MISRKFAVASSLALCLFATACGEQASAPVADGFQAVQDGQLEVAGSQYVIDGPADYAVKDGRTLIRIKGMTGVIKVFETPVTGGKAYTLQTTVERIEGKSPATFRALLARDCVVAAEDFSEQQVSVDPGQSGSLSVTHTFKTDYPCAKMVMHVVNATEADPVVFAISGAELTPAS